MKIILVKGCKDCPYSRKPGFVPGWACTKFGIIGGPKDVPPEKPHPECKLEDKI